MITNIKKIKGLGVFGDFAQVNGLPHFKQFNLIYGDNGSGKTTLSRLFSALQDGEHVEYPDLDFTVSTDTGNLTKGQKCSRKIRVFNSDYVAANIGQFDGYIKHIFIVGEENKALVDEFKKEEITYNDRRRAIELETKACEKLELDRGKVFSAISKTIGEATSGTTLRSYRKPDAETAFANLPKIQIYSNAELETYRAMVRQDQAEIIPPISVPELRFTETEEARSLNIACADLAASVYSLVERTAQSGALARLTENFNISEWVETGLKIHREHASERCEFCDQTLPAERMKALAEHFSVEDQKLKLDIEATQTIAKKILDAITALSLPSKSSFYIEIREQFESNCAAYEIEKAELISGIAVLDDILLKKLTERSVSCLTSATLNAEKFVSSIEGIITLIERHNKKTNDFEAEKKLAKTAIEKHYLSSVAEQVGEYTMQIGVKRAEIKRLTNGSDDLDDSRSLIAIFESITTKKAQVSNAHAGGAQMTGLLKDFLGRADLTFESSDEGYRVRRHGKPAKRLSEGEKTAIAFLYFIVQLHDQEFDINEGVVVIDDPISSLDSSSIYQAFAFLKNAVKDAKQVFLLTHSFDFLKLLLNWLDNIGKNKQAYFMIICAESQGSRDARIDALDQLLVKHPTEYHYLFKVLYSFKADGSILSCYHIPNVARKVLETFLEFHSPSNDSLYKKLEGARFDENKKTAIYKFANDLSHRTGKGFDPALVGETQKNAIYLLDMIKELAPIHYEGLEKLAQQNQV